MIIFPAIDIKDGKVVRLIQGRFNEVTEYSDDPVQMARHWEKQGAQWLHVVDLDGAQTGQMKNFDVICEIVKKVEIPIQVGGGIRELKDIENLIFKAKVSRLILGTRAIEDKVFFEKIVPFKATKIAVSLDCSNGMVAQRGWTTVSDKKAVDFAKELEASGLHCLIYTDISRDGMLTGPNIDELKKILDAAKGTDVIASGGVSSLDDIQKLLDLKRDNLIGVIVGKALYEKKFDLKEAIKLCSPKG